MFVLDTNVISELRQGKPRQSAAVRTWAATQATARLFLSAITILELEKGVLALERRDPSQGAMLRAWLTGVRTAFDGRIVSFGEHAARLCASLHLPNPRAERDAMIAATALEHGFVVVTRNVPDFLHMGVRLLNPWALTAATSPDLE